MPQWMHTQMCIGAQRTAWQRIMRGMQVCKIFREKEIYTSIGIPYREHAILLIAKGSFLNAWGAMEDG